MTWLLVAQLTVTIARGHITMDGPRPSVAEAARILAQAPSIANRTYALSLPPGPRAVVIPSSPTAGPFGEFRPFSPPRRLDGTLLTDPPAEGYPILAFPITPWPWEQHPSPPIRSSR